MNVFTVDAEAHDVEVVMDRIARAVRQWEGEEALNLDASPSARSERLVLQARRLKLQWHVDGRAVIHSTRPTVGTWIIRFQRLVRRLTWWFLEPILQQVRGFQRNVAQVLSEMAERQEGVEKRVEVLEAGLRRLQALEPGADDLSEE